MKHGSLFSGIGGFELAAQWMNWQNVFHCEWNEFAKKVLKYYWPHSISYNDITKTNFTIHRGTIDILTGGFPCQPYSSAGKRLGKEDERHLWPEMCRAIREIQPRWIVGENVFGLVNWNGGLVFEEVQTDLEAEGYKVQPYILPAAAVNAPHRRDRVWFVAHAISSNKRGNEFRSIRSENGEIEKERTQTIHNAFGSNGIERNTSDTNSGNSKTRTQRKILEQQNRQKTNGHSNVERPNQWQNFPTVSPICNGNDGISDKLDGITFSKWRNESIKTAGNAVVPQVVLNIFKAIEQYEFLNPKQ
jgi:DNA (cytosine-5)-methyltransferase 1